ncbi:MAG: integration host factor subunit beta [Bacteroidetes bacterium]|nr:integration host factor subunit beta [Bacteroidota bacterium]
MRKDDIIKRVSDITGIPRTDVLLTIECLFQEVRNTLAEGDSVYFRGFGSFVIKRRNERTAQNIRAKTKVRVPAHYIPNFLPAKILMEQVRELPVKEEKK